MNRYGNGVNSETLAARKELENMLRKIDQMTEYQYHETILKVLRRKQYTLCKWQKDYRTIFSKYRDFLRQENTVTKITWFAHAYLPFLVPVYRKLFGKKGE